ncbi:MAG TPA: hypothetical protein PKA33_05820 [Amaricoccus sp.]|uniref:hypothetical protein n=1 Tax=Amaricoccus sp. TaxID=1872485 RepID=UPI001DD0D73C|nr:hypothetical protein [Amaricoccus sp.]MCB1371846.1 hypothetical protein [Paracoccaceae bacterium]MCC0066685.1 hypothetical protein [Rhodovulum sp.]MCB1374298.1 hypothetical protein [Paracoccaceae bacterium]MCB1402186.1 hypothetical protein [Paracoccaceae bacterium]HMQ94139.1 hypothetical protein [Amaricoccus sp.]
MYLPENDAQMFDILTELRVYAAMNSLPRLAESLDDALVLLASDNRCGAREAVAAAFCQDKF